MLISYLNYFQIQKNCFYPTQLSLRGLSVSIIGSGIGQLGEFLGANLR